MGRRFFSVMIIVISGMIWVGFNEWFTIDVLASNSAEFNGAVASLSQGQAASEMNCGPATEVTDSCRELEQKILSSTLRIEINTWIIYVEGEGYVSLFSNGHGTVLEGRYLLTHNHFRLPLLELLADDFNGEFATIKLFTADGDLLWQGPLSTAGVAFDDSETLLLEFLDHEGKRLFESLGLPSADFVGGGDVPVSKGTTMAQINWDEKRAFIQWSKVNAVTNKEGTPVVQLDNCLIPGASGGGVFLNGAHYANNWSSAAGCFEEPVDESLLHSTAALNPVELLTTIRQ